MDIGFDDDVDISSLDAATQAEIYAACAADDDEVDRDAPATHAVEAEEKQAVTPPAETGTCKPFCELDTCQEQAHYLLDQGFSVVPIAPEGKEVIAELCPQGWEVYRYRFPTHEEIDQWFTACPNANIAIVCGALSGIVALNIDGKRGNNWFLKCIAENVRARPKWGQRTSASDKMHCFYRHPGEGYHVTQPDKIRTQVNVLGDGYYVVVAPSIHSSGYKYHMYKLEDTPSLKDCLVPLPHLEVFTVLDAENRDVTNEVLGRGVLQEGSMEGDAPEVRIAALCLKLQGEGKDRETILAMVTQYNRDECGGSLGAEDLKAMVDSIPSSPSKKDEDKAMDAWLASAQGMFSVKDVYTDLVLNTAFERALCRSVLSRYCENGYIEAVSEKQGYYRVKDNLLEIMDIRKELDDPIHLFIPFNLSSYVRTYRKNIIVIAGETNSGKTAFLFNLVYMNFGSDMNIRYLTSEMTIEEVRTRLDKFNAPLDQWLEKVTFIQRSQNFHDAIDPDGINIVDFLESHDKFPMIADDIRKIFDKLRGGVAIIAVQKKKGEEFGRGGEFTLEKARLAISLYTHGYLPDGIIGSAKVTKAKNIIEGKNPDGKEIFYALTQGRCYNITNIDVASEGVMPYPVGWHYFDRGERDKIRKSIAEYCKERADEVDDEVITMDGGFDSKEEMVANSLKMDIEEMDDKKAVEI